MTTLSERARSLVWAGAFLVELAKDEPANRRPTNRPGHRRHFPTTLDIDHMASAPFPLVALKSPEDFVEWLKDFPLGPLHDSSRLVWPEEKQTGKRKPAR